MTGSKPVVPPASGWPRPRIPIAGEGHDLGRGLAGQLPRAGDDAEASLIPDDSGCMVSLVGDELRAFLVRAVNELTEQILTGEAAPTGTPEPPATSWRRAGPRRTVRP